MTQSQLQPVVFGGLFIGVLSALPIVSIGNCCCLWIIGGGMLTAYLLQRDRSEPLQLGEGAMGGFLAGIAGAVVYVAVSVPINIVTAPLQRGMMEFILNADVPPEVREMIETFGSGSESIISQRGRRLRRHARHRHDFLHAGRSPRRADLPDVPAGAADAVPAGTSAASGAGGLTEPWRGAPLRGVLPRAPGRQSSPCRLRSGR